MKHQSLKRICAAALGIALFVALSVCLQVPVYQNYYLCLGYAAVAVYCCCMGPLAGAAVGSVGVVLYCLLTGGMRGMPGWALGNVVIGAGLGWSFSVGSRLRAKPARILLPAAGAVVFTALGILGVKSLADSLIRAQPFPVRLGMNVSAFAADAAVLLLSLPLCAAVEPLAARLLPKHDRKEKASYAEP